MTHFLPGSPVQISISIISGSIHGMYLILIIKYLVTLPNMPQDAALTTQLYTDTDLWSKTLPCFWFTIFLLSVGIKMQQNGDDGLWKYAMILENSLCAHNKYHAWDENLTLTSQ